MPASAASAFPLASSRSPTATCAPSSRKRFTVASPIPEHPPVTTATLPSSLPMGRLTFLSVCRSVCEEDVLLLGERGGRVRPQLTAEAALLEAPEGGPVAH